jgi:hypothetical protein
MRGKACKLKYSKIGMPEQDCWVNNDNPKLAVKPRYDREQIAPHHRRDDKNVNCFAATPARNKSKVLYTPIPIIKVITTGRFRTITASSWVRRIRRSLSCWL